MIALEFRSPEEASQPIWARIVDNVPAMSVGHQLNLVSEFREYSEPVFIDNLEWRVWIEDKEVKTKCIVYLTFENKNRRKRILG
jgi:hypothetical protein